ncbi:MAG TPA: chemotaxis protein CheW [Pyrinomonadaceae bacterium]|nr:chemotaxis protein CheW [Pyrinomonadaceae bacterium]
MNEADELLRLQTFRTGNLVFAILEDEIATVAEWREPAPLPKAPPAVLGVVSIQGRMLTVLDPTQLYDDNPQDGLHRGSIVALRGDEQLALAIEEIGGAIEIPESSLQYSPNATGDVVREVSSEGHEPIKVLAVNELFAAAMRGRERRRRRF